MRYTALILVTALIVGCGGGSPASVDVPASKGLGDAGTVREGHSLWGLWDVRIKADGSEWDVAPYRGSQLHLNALNFLEPPINSMLKIESVFVQWNILHVDIALRHPFPGAPEFTGFDVKGIVILPGTEERCTSDFVTIPAVEETRLINADGYTRWWNPREFAWEEGLMPILAYKDGLFGTPDETAQFASTLNGYKYFADGLGLTDFAWQLAPATRGMFGSGNYNSRRYKFDVEGPELVFNYAVDASWALPNHIPPTNVPGDFPLKANQPEPYAFRVEEVKNTLYCDGNYGGGDYELDVTVYTWRELDSIAHVSMEIPGAFGPVGSKTPVETGDGWAKYSLKAHAAAPQQSGELQVLIRTACKLNPGYGGRLEYTPLSAFYVHRTAATTLPQGGEPGTVKGFRFGEIEEYLGVSFSDGIYDAADTWNNHIAVPVGKHHYKGISILESVDGGESFNKKYVGFETLWRGLLKYGPNGEIIVVRGDIYFLKAAGAENFVEYDVPVWQSGWRFVSMEMDKTSGRLYLFYNSFECDELIQIHSDDYLAFSDPTVIATPAAGMYFIPGYLTNHSSFLSADGTLAFVNAEGPSTATGKRIFFRLGTPEGLGPPVQLDVGLPPNLVKRFPDVVIDKNGVIHAAWLMQKSGVDASFHNELMEMYYCSSNDGVNFTPPQRLSYDGANNYTSAMIMNTNGVGYPVIVYPVFGYNQFDGSGHVTKYHMRQISITGNLDCVSAPVDFIIPPQQHYYGGLSEDRGDLSIASLPEGPSFILWSLGHIGSESTYDTYYHSVDIKWLYY